MPAKVYRQCREEIPANLPFAFSGNLIPPPIGGDFPAFGKSYRDATREECSQLQSKAAERHHAMNYLTATEPLSTAHLPHPLL
jgi:hypothetical protein